MTNTENTLQTNEAPVPAQQVESVDIDMSAMIAADRERSEQGFTLKLTDDVNFQTLGVVPASALAKLASMQKDQDISVFVATLSELLVVDDRDRFRSFIDESGISVKGISEIYTNILERITGKGITKPIS